MSEGFEVVAVNISKEKGTVKEPVESISLDSMGIENDAHAGPWRRQVSILSQERIADFSKQAGREIKPGEFAENLSIRGIDLRRVAPLDRITIGTVVLQVTQIGKECHGDTCAIFREVGECMMPKEGIFCEVLTGGEIKPGDQGEYQPRPLRFKIITLSDRASAGHYQDLSGPKIREILEKFFADTPWHFEIETAILADDAMKLEAELRSACTSGVDVIITTGGTGVGPRDIAPEVVLKVCEKTLPGIMEYIRVKYSDRNPNAMISRSVAGVTGTTQLYALPGSVRAVEEYLCEILKTIEHVVFMLHRIDNH